jgi:prophage regulatory protein
MAHSKNLKADPIKNPTVWVDVTFVAARFGVSPNSVWRWARTPEIKFPDPVRLTPRVTRWRLADIEQFEETRSAALAA